MRHPPEWLLHTKLKQIIQQCKRYVDTKITTESFCLCRRYSAMTFRYHCCTVHVKKEKKIHPFFFRALVRVWDTAVQPFLKRLRHLDSSSHSFVSTSVLCLVHKTTTNNVLCVSFTDVSQVNLNSSKSCRWFKRCTWTSVFSSRWRWREAVWLLFKAACHIRSTPTLLCIHTQSITACYTKYHRAERMSGIQRFLYLCSHLYFFTSCCCILSHVFVASVCSAAVLWC